ncbi:ATP-binding protein [Peristeroidobacter soli]|uniref:ATP-binding protein n=1 Tax=Peristeroidobacter soli TaxID=2497877 RepID=UPI00101D1E40|nr:ATP-binding protein [Peristeroidobacter soli]
MSGVRSFFRSMTGRIFAMLALGMAAAAVFAAIVTSYIAERDFQRQWLEGAADQIEVYSVLLDNVPAEIRPKLFVSAGPGGIKLAPDAKAGQRDAALESVLAARGGVSAHAGIYHSALETCFSSEARASEELRKVWESKEVRQALELAWGTRSQPPRRTRSVPPQCRIVELRLSDGEVMKLSLGTIWGERERSPLFQPTGIVLLALAIVTLAYVVARFATRPLIRLSDAASELGQNLDRPPLPVHGPTELRQAAQAFNAMQKQLQDHLVERTRMLAAITHDLQTPLTRLRLRMERVDDPELRERLVTDLREMKALIDEGLELARSADTAEPRVRLDLDSLLESLVEDAVDAGSDASFVGGSRAVLSVRPLATRRLFSNLLENAVKYGGSALVSSERHGQSVVVRVRDHGPGLPPEMLERVFDPFVRVDRSRSRETGGAGLGLTIARMLADRNGATVQLSNHRDGGLEATVRWDQPA